MAKANSNQVNLRLSKQAVAALERVAASTGSTKTAIVEQAIVDYARRVLPPAEYDALMAHVAYNTPR